MGSEAVIFALLAVIAVMANEWHRSIRQRKDLKQSYENAQNIISHTRTELEAVDKRNAALESEIQRLRKIPLTESTQKADTSVIKARSAADVRRITEERFGNQPEVGMEN
jgi:hypothetical protein